MDFLEKFTVGSLDTCSYLVDRKYLVDPGGFNPRMRKRIESAEFSLEAILLTHAHADHFAGIFDVRDIYPDCPVYCHEEAVEALARPEKNLSGWLGKEISFTGATAPGEESFLESEYEFEVIYTPGHSPGSISFYWPKNELLVSGDVIFAGGIGRTDLPGGNMAVLKQTVEEKIFTLPEHTRICPGHGRETTVKKEKQNNPYF